MSIEQIGRSPEPPTHVDELDPYLKPNLIVSGLTVKLFKDLYRKEGINFAVVDLDNTLADALPNKKGEYDADETLIHALKEARSKGFLKDYFLLSNIQIPLPYLIKRVEYFAQVIDTNFYHAAIWPNTKPKPDPLLAAFQEMGAKPEEVVVFGDQVRKDVLAANRAGAYPVLRYPHFGRDPSYRKRKRQEEQKIIMEIIGTVPSSP